MNMTWNEVRPKQKSRTENSRTEAVRLIERM